MFNLNEEKIEFTFGTRTFVFLAGQKSQECCLFISDVGIRGIYLSLALGTALLLYCHNECYVGKADQNQTKPSSSQ